MIECGWDNYSFVHSIPIGGKHEAETINTVVLLVQHIHLYVKRLLWLRRYPLANIAQGPSIHNSSIQCTKDKLGNGWMVFRKGFHIINTITQLARDELQMVGGVEIVVCMVVKIGMMIYVWFHSAQCILHYALVVGFF